WCRLFRSFEGPELLEQLFCRGERRRGRRIEPGERARVGNAGTRELEQRLAQVEPQKLRNVVFGARLVVAARVEPEHGARARAACPARALSCRRAADLLRGKLRQPRPR